MLLIIPGNSPGLIFNFPTEVHFLRNGVFCISVIFNGDTITKKGILKYLAKVLGNKGGNNA